MRWLIPAMAAVVLSTAACDKKESAPEELREGVEDTGKDTKKSLERDEGKGGSGKDLQKDVDEAGDDTKDAFKRDKK